MEAWATIILREIQTVDAQFIKFQKELIILTLIATNKIFIFVISTQQPNFLRTNVCSRFISFAEIKYYDQKKINKLKTLF